LGGQRHSPAAVPSGKEIRSPLLDDLCPLHSRLDGPQVSVWMGPGNLAKTGVENPDRPECRVAISPDPSQHQVDYYIYNTNKKIQYFFFFAITFWIQEQNVEFDVFPTVHHSIDFSKIPT